MAGTGVQKFYRYHAYVYDGTRWMILHGRRRAVASLQVGPQSRVLEVGCGTGLNFRYVQAPLHGSGQITGLDFSADMLRVAEKRITHQGWDNVDLIEGDATTMQLGRKFDGILFAYSLTMIPGWPEALRRAKEHLAPGGRLVVLDFGDFRGWGPLAPVMRTWLRLNHVDTLAGYEDELRVVFPNLTISRWLGGYNFTAIGSAE